MKRIFLLATGLSILGGAAAHAEDAKPVTREQCIGVYGALAEERASLIQMFPKLGTTNLGQIDYPGRKVKLLAGSEVYAAASQVYELNYKQMLLEDIVNAKASGLGKVIGLSMDCDNANSFTPTFTMPK